MSKFAYEMYCRDLMNAQKESGQKTPTMCKQPQVVQQRLRENSRPQSVRRAQPERDSCAGPALKEVLHSRKSSFLTL